MVELHDAVIVSAIRTAIGTYGGALADIPAVKLGEICIRTALQRRQAPYGLATLCISGGQGVTMIVER